MFIRRVVILCSLLLLVALHLLGQPGQMLHEVDSLLKVARTVTDPSNSLRINLRLSKIILNGNQSLKYSMKSFQIASAMGDKISIANSLMEISNDYYRQNNLSKSAEAVFAALKLYEQENDIQGQGVGLNTLGQLYFGQSNYNKAIVYFKKATQLHKSINDSIQLADDLNNLGEAYRVRNYYDSALYYFESAQIIYHSKHHVEGLAYAMGNIGLVFAATNKKEEGEKKLQNATVIFTALQDFYPVSIFNIEMAKINLNKNKFKTALKLASKAYAIAKKEGLKEQQRDASWILFRTYVISENYEEAINYLKIYYGAKDSILNEQNIQEVAELQTAYQVSQKENQVNKLAQKVKQNKIVAAFLVGGSLIIGILSFYLFYLNKGLKSANGKLEIHKEQLESQKSVIQQALSEKEVLLKEIHHRVKNNLQIISSLLSLQSKNFKEDVLKEVFQAGQNRIQSIALIHQKLYQSEKLTVIHIQEYIENLSTKIIETITDSSMKIVVQVKADELFLDIDTAVPLGLIINELFTNSIKHAFKGMKKGYITVEIIKMELHEHKLFYSDSGCGIKEGIQPEKSQSLGFNLISLLTRQLRGKLEYYNDKGLNVSIKFYSKNKNRELV